MFVKVGAAVAPLLLSYLPPNGWNCRCTVVQVLRDDYPMSDPEMAKAAGDACTDEPKMRMFRYNAGQEMTVFPKKHPYLPKGCGGCDKQNLVNLNWGKGKPECKCCKQFFLQLTYQARNSAKLDLKLNRPAAIKIKDTNKKIKTEGIYLGKKDREHILSHCYNPHEVAITRKIGEYIHTITHIDNEVLKEKENTQKKIETRHVVGYSVYTFDAVVIERGEPVIKEVELKCEIRESLDRKKLCEYPYFLKILGNKKDTQSAV